MFDDIGLVHVLAAALLAYALYAAAAATVTGAKMRRLTRDSDPDTAYVALCASRGWTYASRDESLPTKFQLMPTYVDSAITPEPQAVNVVTGTYAGRPFLSYEHRSFERDLLVQGLYRYRSESLHLVGFDLGHLHPWLHLQPKRRSDTFERAYAVETTRKSFSTEVLHNEMRDHLLRHIARYQFDGTWLVMVVDGPARPDDLEPRLADLVAFLSLVPEHLLNRY
ncbi:hypothetical protein ACIRON_21320 [Nocardioides sp. NPDC101246]|uniref:hypothetical protein n=1 Tax=Nocardioides sp. NPDC101246 TaxID=3364336 RepID=UPI00382E427C